MSKTTQLIDKANTLSQNSNDNFIKKFGFTAEDLTSRAQILGEKEIEVTRMLYDDVKNLCFYPVDLYRIFEPLDDRDPERMDPHNNKTSKRERLSDENSKHAGHKYNTQKGGKSKYWYSESIIKKFENKESIETLVIVEGEKKSQVGCKYNLPCIGIPGIHNYKDRNTKDLDKCLKDLIKVCQVKNIILLHDADALGPQRIKEQIEKENDTIDRLRLFAAAVRGFRELLKLFNVDFYYSFIKPEFEISAKGLDDLFYLYREDTDQVVKDLLSLSRGKAYFKTYADKDLRGTKLDQLFYLDKNALDRFYSDFQSVLENSKFIFNNKTYLGSNGNAEEIVDDDTIQDLPANDKLLNDSKNPTKDIQNYGFYIKSGRYFKREYLRSKDDNGKRLFKDYEISNYVKKIEYHFIDGTNNTKRLIKLKRYTGQIHNVEVLSSETSRKDAFETILKSHNCTFLGSNYELAKIFSVLMDFQKEAFTISTMGYQPHHNIYAFSNGIINESSFTPFNQIGIAEVSQKSFYVPAWAESNKDNPSYQEDRNFEYRSGNISFATWSKLIYEAFDLNGSVATLFIINALFRDIIFETENFFPFLFLFGPAGVGKSSFTDLFLKLFGKKETGESLKNSTPKGIARKCSQRKNAIVFLKEYDIGLEKSIIKFLKDAYDGAGYTRAQTSNDKRTDTILVESAMFIDGNILPSSESAVFDRMIILNFEKESHTKSETAAFDKLKDESDKGLGQVVHEILKHRNLFKSNFKRCFRQTYEDLKAADKDKYGIDISKLPDRTIKHVSFLLIPYDILRNVLDFPFPIDELIKKILEDAKHKVEMLSELKDVNIFWDAINNDILGQYPRILKDKQYQRVDLQQTLFIKLKACYPIYVEYCKQNNIQFVDFQSLKSLLTAENYAYIPSSQKNRGKQIQKNGFGNCNQLRIKINDNDSIEIKEKEIFIKYDGK